MKKWRIRSLSYMDLEELRGLWTRFMTLHETFGPEFRFFPEDWPQVQQRFLLSLYRDDYVLQVIESSEGLQGYGYGYLYHNFPGYSPRRLGFVQDFFVADSFRGLGAGRALWGALQKWFAGKGVTVVQLNVAAPNQRAQDFWKHLGFRPYTVGFWIPLEPDEMKA